MTNIQNNPVFSVYKAPVTNTIPSKNVGLSDISDYIKSTLKKQTEQIRTGANDKTKVLPYATFSGTFRTRRNEDLIEYSGYFCIDLDNTDIRLKDSLSGDTFLNPALIFVSPRGEGLKVVVKISNAKAENHRDHFEALKKYFQGTYQLSIDEACKDVARACFLCHDPGVYFNPIGSIESDVLLSYLPEVAKTDNAQSTDSPTETQLRSSFNPVDFQKPSDKLNPLSAIELRARRAIETTGGKFDKDNETVTRPGKESGTSGKFNRDQDGLMKFFCFTDHWPGFEPGKSYRCVNVICAVEYNQDWERCIKALAREYLPQQQPQKTASKQLAKDEVTDDTGPGLIRLNSKELYSDIWLFAVKKNKQANEEYIELKGIYQDGFRLKLSSKGYHKRYIDDTQAIFIREQSNIIEEVKVVNIKDAVNEMLEAITDPLEIVFNGKKYSFNPDQLRQTFYKAHYVYVCDSFLEYLPTHTRPILRDTRNESYYYFNNAVARVTAGSVDLIPYHQLPDGCIWKDQLIKRNFEIKDYEISHFERFIDNICNQDRARKLSAVSVIGYLLHNYHKPDDTQTIVANDEEVTDGKTPQGRTGKKILVEAIKQERSVAFCDGKMLRPDDKFVFDNVTDSTQCVWIDDVKKDFDFSILHAVSTNGLSPEVKFKTKFHIPFERSPKIYITSNLAINDEGKTNKARMFVIEFSNHYSQKIIKGSESPIKDEHGCYFFSEDWDADEWNRFDSFMLDCILNYLQKGLLDYKREGLAKNKLMQSTSRDFYEWVQSQNFQSGIEYNSSQYFEDFKGTYYGEESDFKQRGFTNWLKKAAQSYDWIFKTWNSNHIRFFKFQHLST